MAEYKKEFSHLSKYAPELVLTKTFRCRQFEDGLKESIKRYLTAVTSLQVVNFYQLVQAAMKINLILRRRSKFSRGGSSSDKITREVQVDSIHGSATRGKRQGPTMTQSSGRGISTEQEERPECPHCYKNHYGTCRRVTEGCFRCGSTYHIIVNCLRGSRSSRNPQGSIRGGSNVPPSTRDRGRGRGSSGQQERGIASETVNRPTIATSARAYAMRAREDQDSPRVITGNFTVYNNETNALVDSGSTHSYICIE